MSLFKVRDFWTFDLEALQLHQSTSDVGRSSQYSPQNEPTSGEGNFIASVGKFKSIGKQDVFVCGDLRGSLYIVQVPIEDQRRYQDDKNDNDDNTRVSSPTQWDGISSSNSSTGSSGADTENRQLLAATNLNLPIVDLKCGHFTSAIKQSICVLTFSKLIILQVRKHQPIDLLASDGPLHNPSGGGRASTRLVDENLLSHEFEEYIRLDLLAGELARELVILDSHTESNLVTTSYEQGGQDQELAAAAGEANKNNKKSQFAKRSKQIVQQLHLPQRDKIIVQYANQFLITLIDGKKIMGHFSLIDRVEQPQIDVTTTVQGDHQSQNTSDHLQAASANALKMQQMSCYVGTTPMAHLNQNNTGQQQSSSSSLVISFSDHQIYCLPVHKLIDLSKQEIMKRVAQNLLHSNRLATQQLSTPGGSEDKAVSPHWASSGGGEVMNHCTIIRVDIESLCEWSRELVAMPIQMQSLQRQVKSVSSRGHKDNLIISQLLVMSRYNLDLFSKDNHHLWSQRFETPLIHLTAYTLDQYIESPSSSSSSSSSEADANKKPLFNYMDQMVCLLCTDSLSSSSDKSNLVIMKEDQIQWSALLNAKPNNVWRLNLTRMPGVLAMLDVLQSHLIVSYLGTNNNNNQEGDELAVEQQEQELEGEQVNIEDDIVKLEKLSRDETTGEGNDLANGQATQQQASIEQIRNEQRARLAVDVKLEASDKWPQVSVRAKFNIRLEQNVTSVIHNIIATLEFDDLLNFDLLTDNKAETLTSSSSPSPPALFDVSRPSSGCVRIQLGNCWPDRREPITFEATFHLWTSKRDNFGISALNQMESSDDGLNAIHQTIDPNLIPKSLQVGVLLSYHETHSSQMVQETSFLLPINLISQLIHIDYSTTDNGQDLADVLGNLPNYKRRTIETTTTRKATEQDQLVHCADLFLKLDCDLLTFLAEFVEADLICRGGEGVASGPVGGSKLEEQNRRAEILENINLLAQSLDCRLRYKTPHPMSRQLSEDLSLPVIASFGLRFGDIYASISRDEKKLDNSNVTVWLHICDFSHKESSIPEELVTQHMQNWMRYCGKFEQDELADSQQSTPTCQNLLVSIECDRPLPVLFVMDHLIERAQGLTKTNNLKTNCKLITTNDYGTYENFYHSVETSQAHQVAISSDLHESLKQVAKFYQVDHTKNCKELREKLAQESCKFQIATTTTLSLAKRLPSLPDDMTQQLVKLSALAKQCQMNLIVTLNELELQQKLEYELTKVPRALSILKLDSDESRKPAQDWPSFSGILD